MCSHLIKVLLFIFSLFASTLGFAATESSYNLPYGATPISKEIYDLHMLSFYVCCGIGVVVFGVLIYSLIKFRRSKGAVAANFHEHLWVEIVWTAIPFFILVALAIPATSILKRMHNTDESKLTIKVVGYQWKWKYEYLDQGISFFSNLATSQEQINNQAPKNQWFLLEVDNPVVVPVNTKIKLLVTADDVIHDWWIPSLGIKQDAVPGYINENWMYITEVGEYRGQCGELCGVNHGFMPIVIKAVSQADFESWVASHQAKATTKTEQKVSTAVLTPEELLKVGEAEYSKTCAMCHQATGLGLPPTFPALKGSKVATGNPESNISLVLNGVPGTAMQAFGEQLDDKTLAAVISFTRHAWGNNELNQKQKHPVLIQPQDIAKARSATH